MQSAAATALTSSAGSASKSGGAVDGGTSLAAAAVAGLLPVHQCDCVSSDELLDKLWTTCGEVGEIDMWPLLASASSRVRRVQVNAPVTCSPKE